VKQNTIKAKQMLNQANNILSEVLMNTEVIEVAEVKPLLFRLENSLNLLTNKINLAIIIQDEPGGESKKRQLAKEET